ncbi:MAG: ABC transporter substrate-binding protein [Gemmatimonadota bacterium]|nr:ABC transporter substrate-binding protein [Gemmatimonadota bacterium]
MRRGGVLRLGVALACLGGGPACGGPGASPATDGAPDRVVVVAQPYLTYGALWLAETEGLFERRGLDVELMRMAGTEPAVPLLVRGDVDVLTAHPAPGLLNAILRGARVRMVAAAGGEGIGGCSYLAVLARPGLLPHIEPADSRSGEGSRSSSAPAAVSRVSVNRQAVMRYVADRILARRGLDLDDLHIVDVPPAARIEALRTGAIDATLAGEPFLTRTLTAGAGEVWSTLDEALPGSRLSFLFFGPRLLDADRDVGERFLAAYLEALDQLAAGKTPRNRDRLAQAIEEDAEVLGQACWPFADADGRPEPDMLMDFQTWAVERGLLDEIVPLERLWDDSLLTRAHAILDGQAGGG